MRKRVIKSKRNNLIYFVSAFIVAISLIIFFVLGYSTTPTTTPANGEELFKKYISSEIPKGLTNFEGEVESMQGENIYISFTANSLTTFQKLLSTSSYKKIGCIDADFNSNFVKKQLSKWKTHKDSFECYEGGTKNFVNKFLLLNIYTGDVIYNEVRL